MLLVQGVVKLSIAEIISEKKNKISELQLEINERKKDAPEAVVGHSQGKYRLTRGSQISDSRCEEPFAAGGCGALGGDYFSRKQEQVSIWHNKNIKPIGNQINSLEKQIIQLEEKQKIPLLREQLITATDEFHTLSENDPEFRQKQIQQKKSLYEKAVALDSLERKHNLFGNLPTSKREPIIITPEPITITNEPEIIHKPLTIGSLDFDYTKLAIGGVAIVGILALIIWRFK